MIQRIQSVYLGLAALMLIVMLVPGVVFGSGQLTAWGTLAGVGLTVIVILVAALFMYGNRERQRAVVVVAKLLTLVTTVFLYATLYADGELYLRTVTGVEWARLITFLCPLLAYILLLLARRAITSDIELVRSMDRLR